MFEFLYSSQYLLEIRTFLESFVGQSEIRRKVKKRDSSDWGKVKPGIWSHATPKILGRQPSEAYEAL